MQQLAEASGGGQANQFLKKTGQNKQKFWRKLYYNVTLAGLWARFAVITGPRLTDYIPQRMRGMGMDSGQLVPSNTICLKITFLWGSGLHVK